MGAAQEGQFTESLLNLYRYRLFVSHWFLLVDLVLLLGFVHRGNRETVIHETRQLVMEQGHIRCGRRRRLRS